MNGAEIQNKVFDLIVDNLKVDKDSLSLESKIDELSEDSIQLFGLIINFENEFNMKAKYEDLIRLETVGDIINLLKKLLPDG
jgi:acyl carrier protein